MDFHALVTSRLIQLVARYAAVILLAKVCATTGVYIDPGAFVQVATSVFLFVFDVAVHEIRDKRAKRAAGARGVMVLAIAAGACFGSAGCAAVSAPTYVHPDGSPVGQEEARLIQANDAYTTALHELKAAKTAGLISPADYASKIKPVLYLIDKTFDAADADLAAKDLPGVVRAADAVLTELDAIQSAYPKLKIKK